VNLVSEYTFPSPPPRILSRRTALHAVPHSLAVACAYSSSHHPPLTSITPVLPNPSLIPSKYHVFINPPLRRVYLGDRVDNEAVINDLKSEIVCLEAGIETLKSDNESAKRESFRMLDQAKKEAQLALDKVKADAQLALNKAEDDLRLANLSLEECRAENNALKSQWVTQFSSVEPHPIKQC
jgi:hypothetical protein